MDDEEEDKYSAISSGYVSRIPSKNSVSRLSRIESSGPSGSNPTEHSSLLFSHLDKVLSTRSIGTVADDYRYEPHPVATQKSSFTQSIFNSINILIGIGILALPLGFKVRRKKNILIAFFLLLTFFFSYVLVCWLGYWYFSICILLWVNKLYCKVITKMFGY